MSKAAQEGTTARVRVPPLQEKALTSHARFPYTPPIMPQDGACLLEHAC